MSRRRWFVTGAVFVVLLTGWILVYSVEELRDKYRAAWACDLVICFIDENDRPPQNWDELRPCYKHQVERLGEPWPFKDIQSRVKIDFVALNEDVGEIISLYSGASPVLFSEHPDEEIRRFIERKRFVIEQRERD